MGLAMDEHASLCPACLVLLCSAIDCSRMPVCVCVCVCVCVIACVCTYARLNSPSKVGDSPSAVATQGTEKKAETAEKEDEQEKESDTLKI